MGLPPLYAIESDIRGRPAEDRKRERQQRSRPLLKALQVWWREQLGRLSGRSKFAQAIRYAFNH
jgi:transposase